MTFVKFENVGAKIANKISLTKSQSFSFAVGFYRKYKLVDFSFVTLFYDKEDKKIGFQFSKERLAKSSFTLMHSNNKQSGSVIARSFFSNFEIDSNKYQGKYEPAEINDPQFGQMFFITLIEKKE